MCCWRYSRDNNGARKTAVDFSFISWNPPGGLKSFDTTCSRVTPPREREREVSSGKSADRVHSFLPSFLPYPTLPSVRNVLSVIPSRSLRRARKIHPSRCDKRKYNNNFMPLASRAPCTFLPPAPLRRARVLAFRRGNFRALLSTTIYLRMCRMSRRRFVVVIVVACAWPLFLIAKLYITRCNSEKFQSVFTSSRTRRTRAHKAKLKPSLRGM